MQKTRPTMQDVAREAGVSLMTVSRVVNDAARVDEKTRARVHAAITSLGFRRNDMARNLRQGRAAAAIGLIIEDIGNPFYSAIARGVEQVAREHHYMVINGSHEKSVATEHELVGTLVHGRAEGLLIVPVGPDQRYLLPEMQMGIPAIFLDRPAGMIEADAILLDNRGGTRRGIAHLLTQGFSRIGYVGGDPAVYTDAERLIGYREAFAEAGIPVDESLLRLGPHDTIQAEAATSELLQVSPPLDAIFAVNNRMSVGVLRALQHQGMRLPVVGFDDIELADLLTLPIAVVRHNPVEMGRQAAQLLFARLQGDTRPLQRIIIPTELVVRIPVGQGERK